MPSVRHDDDERVDVERGMRRRPDIEACALWLQRHLGAFLFTVDHPELPQCAGAHRPGEPCDGSRGKHPCGRWSRDSTNDADVILAALARGLRNLGADCGKSGLLVVDEDRLGAFAEFAAGIGERVPVTFTVMTSKGRHYYFRQPGELLGNGRGALSGHDCDIRGRGGFVVAPGSVHETGVVYTPVDSSAAAVPAPAWLVTALRSAPDAAGDVSRPRPVADRPSCAHPLKVLTALARTVREARPPAPGVPGERNPTLYWAACRAWEHVDRGLFPAEAARGALLDAARHAGLADGAAIATICSARRMTGGDVL